MLRNYKLFLPHKKQHTHGRFLQEHKCAKDIRMAKSVVIRLTTHSGFTRKSETQYKSSKKIQ